MAQRRQMESVMREQLVGGTEKEFAPNSTRTGLFFILLKRGCIMASGTLLLAFSWLVYELWPVPSNAIRALPPGATDVHEFDHPHMWPDFFYAVKARISEEEFMAFVKSMHLYRRRNTADSPLRDSAMPEWWDSQGSSEYVWRRERDGVFEAAWYENGYLYYSAQCL